MTIKTARRPAGKRLGVRWGLGAKSSRPEAKVAYCCRHGEHGKCSSLSCACPCH
jgi:hypothetical protein